MAAASESNGVTLLKLNGLKRLLTSAERLGRAIVDGKTLWERGNYACSIPSDEMVLTKGRRR